MSAQSGVLAYDLAGNFCEECGRAKMNRLFFDGIGVQDCKTCTEVVTRHRCVKRPDIGSLPDGQSWECPDCGSTWTPRTTEQDCPECCGDCGHKVTVRDWDAVAGDRIGTAPRYQPPPAFTPLRNLLAATVSPRRRSDPAALPSACYRASAGFMVHVTGACRCKR